MMTEQEQDIIYPPRLSAEETTTIMEDDLLQTKFRDEALELLNIVEVEEQSILLKCINREPFNDDEKAELEALLVKYRDALEDQKPSETIENAQQNIQLVHDEKEFLKLLREDKERDVQELTMYYPVGNHELKLIFEVYPLEDSEAILDIMSNLNLFKDLTDDEKINFDKMHNGEELTREEERVARYVQGKISDLVNDHTNEVVIEFLAQQTRLKGSNATVEDMREIYKEMKVNYRLLLFSKVQKIAGLTGTPDTERVFRASD